MRKIMAAAAAAFVLTLAPAWAGAQEEDCASPVSTTEGAVRGYKDRDYAACGWKGIPYAAPPVGDLRLAAPEPPAARDGVMDVLEPGPVCMQAESSDSGGVSGMVSEDCLYLNIWRPQKSGVFPVMFWIHGGGFIGGSGSYDLYDGAALADRMEVVVVTINYRLGPLGFMALPELAAEDPAGSTGNYGILDQIRALEWVRDNITGFGGDPGNVTIFGQSAGGMSVCELLVSPRARGLFHKAASMSGPCHLMTDLQVGYRKSRAFAAKMGCEGDDIVSCLRGVPADKLGGGSNNDLFALGTAWAPAIDGVVLPDKPLELIEAGNFTQVPIMIGSTKEELRIYTMSIPGLGLWSRGMVNQMLRLLTGPRYDEIMAMYSYADYRRPIDLAFAFADEMTFDTPAFRVGEAASAYAPVHVYRFDWNKTRFPHKLGAFHAIDIVFVFGAMNPDLELAKVLASKKMYEDNEPLAVKVMSYYTNFAKTGDPNGPGLPEWPAYSPGDRERLYINTEIEARPLTEIEVRRFKYFATHPMSEIMEGKLTGMLSGEN